MGKASEEYRKKYLLGDDYEEENPEYTAGNAYKRKFLDDPETANRYYASHRTPRSAREDSRTKTSNTTQNIFSNIANMANRAVEHRAYQDYIRSFPNSYGGELGYIQSGSGVEGTVSRNKSLLQQEAPQIDSRIKDVTEKLTLGASSMPVEQQKALNRELDRLLESKQQNEEQQKSWNSYQKYVQSLRENVATAEQERQDNLYRSELGFISGYGNMEDIVDHNIQALKNENGKHDDRINEITQRLTLGASTMQEQERRELERELQKLTGQKAESEKQNTAQQKAWRSYYRDYTDTVQTNKYLDKTRQEDFQKIAAQGKNMDSEGPAGLHYLINHPEEFQRIAEISGEAREGFRHIYMTQREVDLYNYLYVKEGEDSANEYLDYINPSILQRAARAEADAIKGNTWRTIGQGLMSGAKNTFTGIGRMFQDEASDPTFTEYTSGYIASDLEEEENTPLKLAYQVSQGVGQMAPSILFSTATGGLGAPAAVAQIGGAGMVGLSAAGNAKNEALNEGYSVEQANSYGVLSGISETTLQYLLGGVSKLGGKLSGNVAQNAVKNIKSALGKASAQIGMNMFSEGSEEYLQEILEPVFRNICLDENNEFKAFTPEALEAGIVGALTAGLLEGPSVIGSSKNTAQVGKWVKENNSTDALINTALLFDADTEAYRAAKQLSDGTLQKTDSNVGELYQSAVAQLKEGSADKQGHSLNTGIIEQIKSEDVQNDVSTLRNVETGVASTQQDAQTQAYPASERAVIVDGINTSITGIEYAQNGEMTLKLANGKTADFHGVSFQSPQAQQVYEKAANYDTPAAKAFVSGYQNGTDIDTYSKVFDSYYEIGKSGIPYKQAMQNAVSASELVGTEAVHLAYYAGANAAQNIKSMLQSGTLEGKPISVKEIASVENGEVNVRLDDGRVVKATDISFNAPLAQSVYNMAGSFDDIELSQKYLSQYDGTPVGEYTRAFNRANNIQQIRRQGKGGLIRNWSLNQKLTRVQNRQITMLENVAKELGVTIEITNGKAGVSGYYKNGRIYIGLNALNEGLLYTTGHELVHNIKAWNKEGYYLMQDFVLSVLENKLGYNVEKRIQDIQNGYKSIGQTIDQDMAIEELVAKSFAQVFASEENVQRFAQQSKQNRNILQRIADCLTRVMDKIGRITDTLAQNDAEASVFYGDVDLLTQMRDIMNEALEYQDDTNANQTNAAKYWINPDFNKQYDAWDGKNPTRKFNIGTTSKALQSIGVKDQNITWDSSKIIKIKNKHAGMTDEVIKQVPQILENPILIMQSIQKGSRVTIFGEIFDVNNNPILAVLELEPTDRKGLVLDEIKLATAYGRLGNSQNLINNSRILYVEPDKNRTDNWLTSTRLQLPVAVTNYGPIDKISYPDDSVNSSIRNRQQNDTIKEKGAGIDEVDNGRVRPDGYLKDKGWRNEVDSNFALKRYEESGRSKREQEIRIDRKRFARKLKLSEKKIQEQRLNDGQYEVTYSSVKENTYSTGLKAIAKHNARHGENTVFVVGDINVSEIGGDNFVVSGIADESGVVVQIDADILAERINAHEMFHRTIDKNRTEYDKLANRVWNAIKEKEFSRVYNEYVQEYGEAYSSHRKNDIYLEEMMGDIVAGVSQLSGNPQVEKAAQAYREAVGLFDLSKIEKGEVKLSLSPELTKEKEALIERYGKMEPGENPVRNIELPRKTSDDMKVRRFVRTVMESNSVTDEIVDTLDAHVLINEAMSYRTETDQKAMEYAKWKVGTDGIGNALGVWHDVVNGEVKVEKKHIALGEQLLRTAAEMGDVKSVVQFTAELAELGTRAGQTVQAFSLLKKMDGVGQLLYINNAIKTLNKDLQKKRKRKFKEVKLNETMAQKLMEAKTLEGREAIYQQIMKDIGEQVPSTFLDKWNAWRYMSMLFNPRTHVRNILGNAVFIPAIKLKDAIALPLEKLAENKIKARGEDRTKALTVSKEYREYAKADFQNIEDVITSGGKKNPQTMIRSFQKVFKRDTLEKLRNLNFSLLEKEDLIFLKRHYIRALGQYLQANNIDTANISQETLAKARNTAILEAQKATYRDASRVAGAIQKLSDQNRAANILVEGILPFKKTPINILKRGVEYSPAGLIEVLTRGTKRMLRQDITVSQWIDGIGAGLSGTAIMAVGMLLSSLGVLQGGFGDEEEWEKMKGNQKYSLRIGNISITLDWMAPSAIPLFTGVELMQAIRGDYATASVSDVSDAMFRILDPMLQMSMLQGLNDTLNSVSYDENKISAMIGTALGSYFSQAVPSIFGATARTIDKTQRSAYIDKNSPVLTDVQAFYKAAMNKIPGLSFLGAKRIDQWGEVMTNDNTFVRILQNFVLPGYLSTVEMNDTEAALESLFDETGDSKVLPSGAKRHFSLNGETIHLSADEYEVYAKTRGSVAYGILQEITSSEQYKKMDSETKVKAIALAYEFANDSAKAAVSDFKIDGWAEDVNNAYKQHNTAISKSIMDKAEQKVLEKRYTYSDLYDMLYDGGLNSKEARELIQNLKDIGKTEKGIKSSMNTKLKEAYLSAVANNDRTEMSKLRGMLTSTTSEYYGGVKEETIEKWEE